uniref:Uncharacterized protein n=1 Tax=Pseudoalteromonas luteoviolacea TaxID=43657 RepID=A0A023PZ16_9GAMM|nr:hypothetical protein [Pseudoalteromonas luteoviolacea]
MWAAPRNRSHKHMTLFTLLKGGELLTINVCPFQLGLRPVYV